VGHFDILHTPEGMGFPIRQVDRIIVLHKGRLVEEGTHAELLQRVGLYSRLYELQYAETLVRP
jgi:ABC-type transport system involved in cytochrome bd biosynthesis fused ATPase/permease subunit